MLKKILFFLVTLLLFNVAFSSNCSLFLDRNSCSGITSSAFNEFDLINVDGFVDFEAEMYYKTAPSYKIPLIIEDFKLIQQGALGTPGVYILELISYDIAGNSYKSEFEILFDNTISMPPIIPVELISNEGSIQINGLTTFSGLNVVVEDLNGIQKSTVISENNGSFSLNLVGLNAFEVLNFYTIGTTGLKSKKIQRIVQSKRSSYLDLSSSIDIDDLVQVNSNTILESGVYISTKREFLITGTANGDFVYVNGIKTPVIDGRFGAFIHLNEGITQVYLTGNDIEKIVNIEYFKFDFIFTKIEVPSLVSSQDVEISVETNLNLDVLVYLNGKIFSKEKGDFSIKLNNLRHGRNILTLIGPNGKMVERHIFLDLENPIIEIKSSNQIFQGNNFVFTIKDDVGLDLSSLEVKIGPNIFSGDIIDMMGDYFIINLEGLEVGEYSILISVNDLSGKNQNLDSHLEISNSITSIFNIYVDNNGYFLGDKFFFNSKDSKIILNPSKNIAFKNIYVDGYDVIDYIIKPNHEIEIDLKLFNNSGEIELIYIDSTREEYIQKFKYEILDKNPKFVLYGANSLFSNLDLVLYGEIQSNHFNWDSLKFNDESSYIKRGNFVEIYLNSVNTRNLEVLGEDFGMNLLSTTIGSLFNYPDLIEVGLEEISNYDLNGNFNIKGGNAIINLISFDSFNFISTILNDNFILPISSRYGIRSSKLNFGIKNNYQKDFSLITTDGVAPIVYLINDLGTRYLIIDGTGSKVDLIEITKNFEKITSFSYCDDKIVKFGKNYKCVILPQFEDDGDFLVETFDKAGNLISKNLNYFEDSISLEEFENLLIKSNIFISGTDIFVSNSQNVVQGSFVGLNLKSIKIGNSNCDFDSTNFVCNLDLDIGINNLKVVAEFENEIIEKNVEILVVGDSNLIIDEIRGEGVFKVNSNYYYIDGLVFLDLLNNDFERLEILVDGFVIDSNSISNSISLDLGEVVSGFNEKELEIKVRGEKEDGTSSISNEIILIYKRVIETFVKVFVG